MAHDFTAEFQVTVGDLLEIILPELVSGLTLVDLDEVLAVNAGGTYVVDPVNTLGLTLTEVDAINATGIYLLELAPQYPGTLYLRVTEAGVEYEYSIQVAARDNLADASLEGEYVLTVEDGLGPVQGAVVRVFDAAGTKFVTRGTTDSLGQVTFTLPVGNYQIRSYKDGVDFSAVNPSTITVTATSTSAPILDEILPTTASIGDVIAIVGRLFDPTSQVLFGGTTVAADHVNPAGTVILVTVPAGLTDTVIPIRVDKPDPADLPLGKLLSNTLTMVLA